MTTPTPDPGFDPEVFRPLARTVAEAIEGTPVQLGSRPGIAHLASTVTACVGRDVLPQTPGLAAHMAEVDAERQRQLARWGDQRHPDLFGDESDRAARRAVFEDQARRHRLRNDHAAAGSVDWTGILLEEVHEALAEADPARLRAELVQCAAVIQAWLWDLDNRQSESGATS
jgi:hypothetical protein